METQKSRVMQCRYHAVEKALILEGQMREGMSDIYLKH